MANIATGGLAGVAHIIRVKAKIEGRVYGDFLTGFSCLGKGCASGLWMTVGTIRAKGILFLHRWVVLFEFAQGVAAIGACWGLSGPASLTDAQFVGWVECSLQIFLNVRVEQRGTPA